MNSAIMSLLNKHGRSEELVTCLREKKCKAEKGLDCLQMSQQKLTQGQKILFSILLMPQCKTMKFQQRKNHQYLLN